MTAEIDPSFERLLEYVRDARAFDYTGYRRQSLMRRFEKRLHAVGSASFDEYRAYLGEHPEEFNELFNTILINVTGFFRDREAWDLVSSQVIPAVLEKRGHGSPIRVWSAGCASGEEPYTIAILLAEALGEEAYRARVKIYATDVDEDALAQARDATYTLKQLEGVSDDLRERYFQSSDHAYMFRTELRRAVIFGRNDLHRDPPISRVDLLVSRNTLMYFSPEVQERILANFYFALNRGGFLVLGKAEALQSRTHLFTQYDLKRRVFVKDGSADADFRVPRGALRIEPTATELGSVELGDTAFEHAPVAQIVVDRENRVAALNHSARAMFGLTLKDIGRPLRDLEVSYRPLDLRTIIDRVNSDRRAVSTKDVVLSDRSKADKLMDVQVGPLTGATGELVGISVSFVDVTAQRSLQTDLQQARRELESAYEELQSTVEELETTNEELQSTNEELETTNEELQSTNEELETMNEELQSTNEELETMNDELRDRTHDALVANTFLSSVLSSINQAVIVVDRDLAITAWSDAASELWGLRDDEVEGKHLLNLDIALPLDALRDPIRNVLAGEAQDAVTIDGHDRRGHLVRYTISLTPLPGLGEEAAGAVLAVSAERLDALATG
jgi:two-component system, chemotaxis family, CheB/CheR fusion protein